MQSLKLHKHGKSLGAFPGLKNAQHGFGALSLHSVSPFKINNNMIIVINN